jgi:hypothetical protein
MVVLTRQDSGNRAVSKRTVTHALLVRLDRVTRVVNSFTFIDYIWQWQMCGGRGLLLWVTKINACRVLTLMGLSRRVGGWEAG